MTRSDSSDLLRTWRLYASMKMCSASSTVWPWRSTSAIHFLTYFKAGEPLSRRLRTCPLLVLRGLSRLRQANRHPCRLTPLSLLFHPHSHQLIINVGDSAAVVSPEMDVPLDNCGRAIGTDMKIRQIECQKLVRATSHAFQVLGFVLHCSVGVRVREIVRFATVHGCDVSPQFGRIAVGVDFEHFLIGVRFGITRLSGGRGAAC